MYRRRTVPSTPTCSRNSDELFSKKEDTHAEAALFPYWNGAVFHFTYSNYGIQRQRGRGEICVLPLTKEPLKRNQAPDDLTPPMKLERTSDKAARCSEIVLDIRDQM